MDTRLTDCWEELSDFIVYRNSIDLGVLHKLHQIFSQDSSFDPSTFADQIATFLSVISSQAKRKVQGQADQLAILSIDCLISNLYRSCRNGDFFQPNNSMDFGWMSSSQMSMDHSNISQRQSQLIPQLVNGLANSQNFFKRLNASMQKSHNQQKMKKYIECLLQTIDFILNKQHINRQNFLKFRGKYIGLQSRRKWEVHYHKVNSIIFSSQLNKVVAVLTQGRDHLHSSLLRIYLGWQEDSKMYEGLKFNGQQMLINLYRYYVSSFRDIDQLFEQGKHPIFRFLRNHLALLFTPVLRRFHQLVVKISGRCGNEPGYPFFKKGSSYLQGELIQFVNQLPVDLLKLLMQLKDLLEEQHAGQSQYTLPVIKKMFFYSFLLNQPLIEQLYPRHDPSKWGITYNNILNLFFESSIKKYSHLPQSHQSFINQLIQKISHSLDSRIVNLYIRVQHDQSPNFKIKDAILNHDFENILTTLSSLEFTPKDSKQFQMKKPTLIAPESPVYRHFKGQGFKLEQTNEELELATWMSVGGSREWKPYQSKSRKTSVGDRLKGYKIIDAGIRSRLLSQSEQLRTYFQ